MMTNSNNVISTIAYDPKKSTNVWNFRTPSTSKTKKANQQMKNMAAYFIFRFFSFIIFLLLFHKKMDVSDLPLPFAKY